MNSLIDRGKRSANERFHLLDKTGRVKNELKFNRNAFRTFFAIITKTLTIESTIVERIQSINLHHSSSQADVLLFTECSVLCFSIKLRDFYSSDRTMTTGDNNQQSQQLFT